MPSDMIQRKVGRVSDAEPHGAAKKSLQVREESFPDLHS